MPRKHVVITGTGRTGTTFLVELLTHLGVETGFKSHEIAVLKDEISNGGLEFDIRHDSPPYVVKSPWFCDYAEEVMSRDDIVVEHVFVPLRDLHAAAESRRFVTRANVSRLPVLERFKRWIKPPSFVGGMWHTRSFKNGRQEEALVRQMYKLLLALSSASVPITFLHYPRLVKDCPYLFAKLRPVLGDMPYHEFRTVFERTVRPDLVHSFNENDR
jgi:hypothetical protein